MEGACGAYPSIIGGGALTSISEQPVSARVVLPPPPLISARKEEVVESPFYFPHIPFTNHRNSPHDPENTTEELNTTLQVGVAIIMPFYHDPFAPGCDAKSLRSDDTSFVSSEDSRHERLQYCVGFTEMAVSGTLLEDDG